MKIFAIGRTRSIAEKVCDELDLRLSQLEEKKFPDGEMKIHPLEKVEGHDVFVFHSLGSDNGSSLHDKICELYFLLSSLKDQGARSLTVAIPYICYARSDLRKEPFDPLTNRYLAELVELVRVKRVLGLDVHNIPAFENAYHCPAINLEAAPLFIKYIHATHMNLKNLVIFSPDIGGIKRTEKFRGQLQLTTGEEIKSGFIEKYRTSEGLYGQHISDVIEGKNVLIYDDMISTGGTILKALDACHKKGASSVRILSTHGIFCANRDVLLKNEQIEEIVVTDSHPVLQEINREDYPKLKTLSCAPLFAHMIRLLGGTHESFPLRGRDDWQGNRPDISLFS